MRGLGIGEDREGGDIGEGRGESEGTWERGEKSAMVFRDGWEERDGIWRGEGREGEHRVEGRLESWGIWERR